MALGLGQRLWAGVLDGGELPALAVGAGERLFELALQRSGDEPVLRLACVELALCPFGLVLGALEREPLTGEALLVRTCLTEGSIYTTEDYGHVDFTVPRFGEFMRRHMPFKPPPAPAARERPRRGS